MAKSPTSTSVAELIRARMGECSPAELKVARAILAGYPSLGLETVAAVAEHAGVSGPTVLRLLTRLGFGGYPDFQRALRAELADRNTSPLSAYTEQPSPPGGTQVQARSVLSEAVSATLAELPEAELDAAVRLLADRHHRITAHGGRFSRLLAHYLVLHLVQIRGNSRLLPESGVERADVLAEMGKRDVLVLFDYRRYEEPTRKLAEMAVERGARVMLFTDRWLSPIAGVAEVVLPSRVDSPSAYDSFVPTVAVLETLIAALLAHLGPAARDHLAAIEAASLDLDLL